MFSKIHRITTPFCSNSNFIILLKSKNMPKQVIHAKKENNATAPRPLNCFLLYRIEKQKQIVARCPGANHRDISKIIAKWWKEATDEEKQPFREQARIAKQEHRKMYPDYKYTPKKKDTPKRPYNRKSHSDKFTSLSDENNKFMEMIYEDADALKSAFKPKETASASKKRTRKVCKKVTKKDSPIKLDIVDLSPPHTPSSSNPPECNIPSELSTGLFSPCAGPTTPMSLKDHELFEPGFSTQCEAFGMYPELSFAAFTPYTESPSSPIWSIGLDDHFSALDISPLMQQLDSQEMYMQPTAEQLTWDELNTAGKCVIPFINGPMYQLDMMTYEPTQYINPLLLRTHSNIL